MGNSEIHSPTLPGRRHLGPNKGGKNNNKDGKNGKKGKKGKGDPFPGPYSPKMYKTARRLVQGSIFDALKDIRKERRMVRRLSRNERNKTQSLYKRTRGDINHIFDETGAYIGQQNQQMIDRNTANRSQSEAAQQALMQQLAAGSQQTGAGANAELDRLGINAPNTLGQFAADAANNAGLASIQGANASTNQMAMQGASAGIGNLLSSMNEGSRGSLLGNALNERNLSMKDIQQRRLDAEMEIREAMRETRGQRSDMVLQMLEQLRQSGYMDKKRKGRRGSSNSYSSYNSSYTPGSYDSTYTSYGGNSSYNSGGSRGNSEYPDYGTLGNKNLNDLMNLYK